MQRLSAIVCWVALVLWLPGFVHPADGTVDFAGSSADLARNVDARFLDGLRQRRLYDLAVTFCQKQLARSPEVPEHTAWWTAALVRTWSEWALARPAQEREAAWAEARQAADAYLARNAQHNVSIWVRLQRALVDVARGTDLWQNAEIVGKDSERQVAMASEALRAAAQQLEQIERWLDSAIPTAPPAGAVLSHDDLFALRNQVRVLRAQVMRYQALCYPEGEDRVGLIVRSLEALRDALAQMPAEDLLAWQARLEQVIAFRLLGDVGQAERTLGPLLGEDSPAEIRPAAWAEYLRLLVMQGRWSDAWQKLVQSQPQCRHEPQWQLAALEVVIALWQRGVPVPDNVSGTWRDVALERARYIEQTFGPYWGRRAENRLLHAARSGGSAGDAELLRRQADDLYLRGQLDEALAAYDAAVEAAARLGAVEEEWTARGRAARLAEQKQDTPDAARRWHAAAHALPQHRHAPVASLRALALAADALRTGQLPSDEYGSWLIEHVQRWPDHESADNVRLALAQWYASRMQWDDALECCRQIRAADVQCHAWQLALVAWRTKIHQADAHDRQKQISQALQYFEQCRQQASSAASVAEADLARTELVLQWMPDQAGQVAEQLARWDGNSLTDDQRVRWQAWRLAALAIHNTAGSQEVETLLEQIPADDPQLWSNVAKILGDRLEKATQVQRQSMARVLLQVLQRWHKALGAEAVEQPWELIRLQSIALVAAGRPTEAVVLMQEYAQKHSTNADVQIHWARILEAAAPHLGWQRALDQWRIIAAAAPPRSDTWFEAKLGVARILAEMGHRSEAEKLLRYVLLTSPPPQGSLWQERYRQALARLQE
jgi:tetratricopeptide (TPR) repeat protein